MLAKPFVLHCGYGMRHPRRQETAAAKRKATGRAACRGKLVSMVAVT